MLAPEDVSVTTSTGDGSNLTAVKADRNSVDLLWFIIELITGFGDGPT